MKRRFILVDTENVQNRWFELLGNLRGKDRIIVFYTENHSKMLQNYLEVSKGGKRLRWVECISGENALDYQLLGVLSYLIYKHPKAEYTIYSNDKGYQDTVSHWKDKGVRIRLAGFSTEKIKENLAIHQENNEADIDNSAKDNRAVEKTEKAGRKRKKELKSKQKQISVPGVDDCVWEVGKALPFAEKAAYYTVLTDILGQERGGQQYQLIRSSEECQEILKGCYLENQRERTIHLLQTILQYHTLDKSYAKVIYQIVENGDLNNLQAIKKSFDKKIGTKAEHQKYYTVMKKYFKLIKKMVFLENHGWS